MTSLLQGFQNLAAAPAAREAQLGEPSGFLRETRALIVNFEGAKLSSLTLQ